MGSNANTWLEADADAHETKAEALEHARDTLHGVLPIMDTIGGGLVSSAVAALEAERKRHEEKAAVIRGRVAA
jgi:hypothetical protein